MLANRSAELAKEIVEVSALIFCDVSVEDVASSVFDALNDLSVEDCWDASGRQRGGGYRDEFDVADEMIGEAFSSFIHKIDRFHITGEHVSELAYIQGVLLGLYQYKIDSTTDFSENYGRITPNHLRTIFLLLGRNVIQMIPLVNKCYTGFLRSTVQIGV